MMVGHYVTALVPHSRLRNQCPFWLLLLCSQVPEFFWLILSLAGVETPTPNHITEATFNNLQVQMTYSHNALAMVIIALVVFGVVWAATKNRAVAVWCGVLSLVHVLCDFIVGFEHQLIGLHSMPVALNSYGKWPHLAVLFEFVFSLAIVYWYIRDRARQGRPLALKRKVALFAVFSVGVLAWLPSATKPLKDLM